MKFLILFSFGIIMCCGVVNSEIMDMYTECEGNVCNMVTIPRFYFDTYTDSWEKIENMQIRSTSAKDGYAYGLDTSEYSVYFGDDVTVGPVVFFESDNVEISFQPLALNYNNRYGQIQQINMPAPGSVALDKGTVTYLSAYGEGIDLMYSLEPTKVKEELIIQSIDSLPDIQQYVVDGGEPVLELNFNMATNANKIIVDGLEWDKKADMQTFDAVEIKDVDGSTIYSLDKPYAYDSSGAQSDIKYVFKASAKKLYVSLHLNHTWLAAPERDYPVHIDPSIDLGHADIIDDSTFNCRRSDGVCLNENDTNPTTSTLYVSDAGGWENKFILKINMTPIADAGGISIDSASLSLYLTANGLDAATNEWTSFSFYEVWQNFTWDESTITYRTRPVSGTDYNPSAIGSRNWSHSISDATRRTFNIESNMDSQFVAGASDFSVYYLATDSYSDDGYLVATDAIGFSSTDHATTSYRPYVNITYSVDTTAPTISGQTPTSTNSRNPTISITTNEAAACKWALADLNYTLMNWTLNTSGLSHSFNYSKFSVNTNNSFYVSCNDSNGNWNINANNYDGWLELNNTLPEPTNILLSPLPADDTTDLNCSYTYSDADSDAFVVNEFKWFNGTSELLFNTSTLTNGNLSNGENWTCSVRVNDGYDWGLWANSSTATINDLQAPAIYACTFPSTAVQNTAAQVCCNATDNNYLAVNYPKFQLLDPNLIRANYSYNLRSGDKYCRSFTAGTVGQWVFEYAHALDGNGNSNTTFVNYTMLVTSAPAVASGGGGGGIVDSACGITLFPETKNIFIPVSEGKKKKYEFMVRNDLNTTQNIGFFLDSTLEVYCDLSVSSFELDGQDTGTNFITCNYAEEQVVGKLQVIYGTSCSDSYDVYLRDNSFLSWTQTIMDIAKGEGGIFIYLSIFFIPLGLGLIIASIAGSRGARR